MTSAIIRIYETKSQGTKAAESLREQGYEYVYQFTGSSDKPDTASEARNNLITSMMSASVWKSHAEFYANRLTKGKTLVLVHAPFGTALNATSVLEDYEPIESGIAETDHKDDYQWDDAAPLSSLLRMPTLSKDRLPAETLSGISSLTTGKAFLSDLLGIPLLQRGLAHSTSSMGLPLLSNSATPLSSLLGLRTISQSATPLSSLFRIPTLKKRK
jgi:hypothetical protein